MKGMNKKIGIFLGMGVFISVLLNLFLILRRVNKRGLELDEWVKFYNPGGDYNEEDFKEKKKLLVQKLKRLRELIEKRRVNFSKGHCFMWNVKRVLESVKKSL